MLRVTMIGSGTSSGVPVIGCRCETCTSRDARDNRLRSSIWIETDSTSIVVDTSSDFRLQCLNQNINRLDAIVYTHHHYDHISGFDDLRAFNYLLGKEIAVYMTSETEAYMKTVFGYAFFNDPKNQSSKPMVNLQLFSRDAFTVGDITFEPLDLMHGTMPVKGFRINAFAYCTDCNMIPDETIDKLKGLDVLILDGLRPMSHPTHFTFYEAIDMAAKIGAKQTYITHIGHNMKHEDIELMMPKGVNAGYDGLTITVEK